MTREAEEIYRELRKELLGRARFLIDDGDLADDIVHDAFLVYLRHVTGHGTTIEDPRAYLLACISKIARNERERTRRRGRRMAMYSPLPRQREGHDDAASEVQDLCERVLCGLPPADRELLRLRYIEGLPATVIAARSGASAGAVTDRLYRARRRAREVAYAELGARGFP